MNTALILRRHPQAAPASTPSALAIGNFDGVHRGHQAILAQVHDHATSAGLLPTVMTFAPHPRLYFARLAGKPQSAPAQISTLRDKVMRLAAHGMRQIVILRFNQALAHMDAEDFVRTLLVKGLATRWLLVGADFRFGHRRTGDVELLRRLGPSLGMEVQTLEDITDTDGQRISSSTLRTVLARGDIPQAKSLLGGWPQVSGHVIHGQKLGRSLGFPTLNMRVPDPCALRRGIYVVRVHGLGPVARPGVASLGVRPSVTERGTLLLETHLLDAKVDAYGKLVCVELLHFMRDEKTFSDLPSLGTAIANDAHSARLYFASHGL